MEFCSFVTMVKEEMKKRLGAEYDVKVSEVMKNNGVLLTGLTIIQPQVNISPIIYLDDYYEIYKNGKKEMVDIMRDIMETYTANCINHTVDMQFFTNYAQVKEHIIFKLVNYEKNRELLQDVPYVPFHDLAIVFQCLISNEKYGSTSIMIHHAHLKLWNLTIEELYQHAMENMPKLYPYELRNVKDVVLEMIENRGEDIREIEENMDEIPLFVLTNVNRIHGASSLLYQNIVRDFALAAGKNVFILPSSIHEVLLMAESGEESIDFLKQMVHDVNETEVEAEEFLSEHIYYYNRDTDKIVMY